MICRTTPHTAFRSFATGMFVVVSQFNLRVPNHHPLMALHHRPGEAAREP